MCVNIMTSLFMDFICTNPLLERPRIYSINRGVELCIALGWMVYGPFSIKPVFFLYFQSSYASPAVALLR